MSNASSLRVPKYRRHKAKGLAVVTLNGRDIYLGKYGSAGSKQEYQRLIAEYMQGGGVLNRQLEVTIAEVMVAYTRFAKGYYRKNSKVTREYELICECCRFIKPLYARTLATEFGPLRLKTVRQAMIDADHSRNHINKNIGRIRRMFKWAAAEEIIPADVPQSLSMVSGLRRGRTKARETPPVLPIADETVEATLEHLPDVVADMVLIQRFTGCRPAEVCMIRPCDIDRNGEVWQYRPESHKTEHHGRERIIFLGPKAQDILVSYLVRDAQMYCFRPCDSEEIRRSKVNARSKMARTTGSSHSRKRVRNPKRKAGECYSTASYRRAIHRATDKAYPHPELGYFVRRSFTADQKSELRKWQSQHRWSPNRLRHAAATEVRREHGLEAAQIILGHSQASVTQVYAERDIAKGLEVAKQIG